MNVADGHSWALTPQEARAVQAALASQVSLTDAGSLQEIRLVAGVDNTYLKAAGTTTAYAVVIVLSYPDLLEVVETTYATRRVEFPYVPGLLSFREGPTVLAAFERLVNVPDLILFDGQGYAHPRRCGLASHLGVVLDRPSIGCAKSRLVGRYDEPAQEFGATSPLVDRGEIVGTVVRTRPSHAPLFVSPGHQVSVDTAVALTLACCRDRGFMPVPTRLAHEMVTAYAGRERASPSA